MKQIKCLSILVLLLTCTLTVNAWDAVGHRIVAEVAYQNLTKKARKQVDNILGTRGIVYKASWADEIKSDTIYPHSYGWHFQNLPAGLSNQDITDLYNNPKAQGEHLFYALDSLTRVLQADNTNADALKFVVHLIGDMFQPMHLGHPNDKGGNKVQMRWFGRGTNLHTVWDRWLIDNTQYTYLEYVTYLTDTYGAQKKQLQQLSLLDCLFLTYDRQQRIYDYQTRGDNNNYHYAYAFRHDLDLSLYTAGLQLAKALNTLYR